MKTHLDPATPQEHNLVKPEKASEWRPTNGTQPITIFTVKITNAGSIYQIIRIEPQVQPEVEVPQHNNHNIENDTSTPMTTPNFRARHPSQSFQTYLSRAQDWEAKLLTHVRFAHNISNVARRIDQCRTQQQSLIAITDYSYHQQTASYGWMICLPNGEALAECNGPNVGPPSGPRAAAWGILSVTTFLAKLLDYLQQPYNYMPMVHILSRNSKHTNYLRQRPGYPTLFCNITLANNWDILEQTHECIKQSQLTITWDNLTEYRKAFQQLTPAPFSLDQSLTDVRETTRDFARLYPEVQHTSPFLPASRCMLYSETSTFHAAYNKIFREAATIPVLQQYLQDKHNWSQETTDQIQWECLRQAIQKYKAATPNHLTKLVYNQLATPARKSKAGGQHWQDPTCPHCHLQPESFDHLLRCSDKDATDFRKNLIRSINSHCTKHYVPPTFQTFLIHSINTWLEQKQTTTLSTRTPQIRKLVISQNKIGWTNLTRGFLSKEWNTMLSSEIATGHQMKGSTSEFFSKLIVILWNEQTAFWKAYQDRRHAKATTIDKDKDTEKMTETKNEIKYLFSLRDTVLPAHTNSYFPQDLDTFLRHSTQSQLYAYVQNYGKAIKLSIKQHKDQSVANTRNIFTYQGFHRIEPNHNIAGNPPPPNLVDATTQHEPPTDPTPILPPTNIPPPAPNETGQATPIHATQVLTPRNRAQQSILATFTRRRPIREITTIPPAPPVDNHTVNIITPTNNMHQTVGEYINLMIRQPPPSNTSTTDTEETTTPPVIATRASPHYKHSKWRPAALVREKFSQYFRKR
jgi:hypothetical protein